MPTTPGLPPTAVQPSPLPRRGFGWLRRCGQVVAWVVILAAVAVLAVGVVVPRVAGATPYTVLTSSMRPGLPPGTLVVSRPVPLEEIGVGTVVTYQLRSGEPQTVTHRVVEVRSDLRGNLTWRTQGDANPAPDPDWVRAEQLRGELWYAVPRLGRVARLFNGDQRDTAVLLVAGALLAYALVMFARAGRERRRAAITDPAPSDLSPLPDPSPSRAPTPGAHP